LVPLVGTAPTSYNYVAADYNRKTGLNSDGTKYLDANRDNSLDPQNNRHFAFMPTSIPGSRDLIDVVGFLSGGRNLYTSGQGGRVAISSSLSVAGIGLPVVNTLLGASRFNGTSSVFRTNRLSTVLQVPSLTPSVGELRLSVNWNARLAFYSIGESLDLAKLDARVTDLINAFGVAIP
jgi:hypothetical protein